MDSRPGLDVALPDELVLGDWRVRPAEGVLLAPGRQLRLEPKVAALLSYLIRHRDRMVSKEELLSAVWPDVVVAPVALARAVSELRRALDDDPRTPRYIETYPKRGYRLVAPEPTPARAAGRPAKAWVAAAAALTLCILAAGSQLRTERRPVGPPLVVVSPFRSLSGDAESTRFAAGLTEDVLSQLSRIGDVRVVQASEAAAPRTTGLATTLEGSVRRDDGQIRIVARLVERGSGAPLWTETYDRAAGDALGVQRDVAVRVVHGLRVYGLGPRGLTRARLEPPPVEAEPTAYDLFRRGRELLARRDLRGVLTGQEAFERSLRMDPGFALGRTGLVLALAMRTTLTGEPAHARRGLQEAQRVAAASPDLPEAHQALGRVLLALHRYDDALVADEAALRLQPAFLMPLADRAEAWARQGRLDLSYAAILDLYARNYAPWQGGMRTAIGAHLLEFGFDADARAWLEAALWVEPQRHEANEALARLEVLQGNRPAGRRRLARWVDADPACRSARLLLGQLALLDGDLAQARAQFEGALALPGDPLVAKLLLAAALSRAGAPDRAEPLLREVEALSRSALSDGSQWWGHPWSLGAVAALRRDARAAADFYDKALTAGRREARWDRIDPLFENVRQDPAFAAALHRADALVTGMRPSGTPPRPPQLGRAALRDSAASSGS